LRDEVAKPAHSLVAGELFLEYRSGVAA
jgi:hypothetical protein